MADYTNEIKKILKKAYDNLIEEAPFDEFVAEMFEATGTSYKALSEEIEIGIQNGCPLELQLMIMEAYLTK
jgi:hypothetical protein